MSSTAVAVARVPTPAYLSTDVFVSRVSPLFVRHNFPHKSRCSQLEMTVSACLNLTSFTCVLEFVVDSTLEQCDVLLGLDWSRQCHVAGMMSFAACLPRLHGIGA